MLSTISAHPSLDGALVVPMAAWIVTVFLIAGALIDGLALRVPNWLTFPMIFSGWAVGGMVFGWAGLWASILGTLVGLALLIPLYAIGGMGAGDVKLLAGVGAWIGAQHTLWAFVASVLCGGLLALLLAVYRGQFRQFVMNMRLIAAEILFVRDVRLLAKLASERKRQAILLPYGIPIALGCISYLLYQGMLP
ncbi:MAG: A24 family peptidase [Thermoguttaceae bacterium]|nr:A24 family peptidase [Thermoguttaceae bacterium]MDW8078418.1 A24 family peptidase [Thermoguttaceae bacterium]